MIAILATAVLTLPHAKADIADYERAYWSRQNYPNAVTSVLACRRRSPKRVACVTYTRVLEPEGVIHFTTSATARLLKHGIVKIEPSHVGIIDTERTLR